MSCNKRHSPNSERISSRFPIAYRCWLNDGLLMSNDDALSVVVVRPIGNTGDDLSRWSGNVHYRWTAELSGAGDALHLAMNHLAIGVHRLNVSPYEILPRNSPKDRRLLCPEYVEVEWTFVPDCDLVTSLRPLAIPSAVDSKPRKNKRKFSPSYLWLTCAMFWAPRIVGRTVAIGWCCSGVTGMTPGIWYWVVVRWMTDDDRFTATVGWLGLDRNAGTKLPSTAGAIVNLRGPVKFLSRSHSMTNLLAGIYKKEIARIPQKLNTVNVLK